MDIIRSSPEHHFVGMLERLKSEPQGWVGLYYAWSNKLNHDLLLKKPALIEKALADLRSESEVFLNDLHDRVQSLKSEGFLYHFSDGDVLLLIKPKDRDGSERIAAVHQERMTSLHATMGDYFQPAEIVYKCQKLGERKLLLGRLMKSYTMMADANCVSTIGARRKMRNEPLVMLVEDDRFTASYTANLLNGQYDFLHAKTGEDAIALYIEQAPDLLLLDIHLPGITGHQTLAAIKNIDSEAQIIMLSVDTAKDSIIGAKENGAAGFLKKPYSKDRLLQMVRVSPLVRRCGHKPVSTPATMLQ